MKNAFILSHLRYSTVLVTGITKSFIISAENNQLEVSKFVVTEKTTIVPLISIIENNALLNV